MLPSRICSLAFLLSFPFLLPAAGLEEEADFVSARQALADGLPGVAGVKAERLLKKKGWDRLETKQLATFAAEAWSRAKNGPRIMALAKEHDLEDEAFWIGQAYALQGDLASARQVLTEEGDSPPLPRRRLLLGQVLGALGEYAFARDELAPLLKSLDSGVARQAQMLTFEIGLQEGHVTSEPPQPDDAAAAYLGARALLQKGQFPEALERVQKVLDSTAGGERIHHAAIILQAELRLRQQQAPEAMDNLLKFLDATAQTELWTEAFDLLDRAHNALPPPRLLPEAVLRWISSGTTAQQQSEPPPAILQATAEVRGHAIFVTARWLARDAHTDEAIGLLEGLFQLYPEHPRLSDAMNLAMELYAERQADSRVLSLADAWRQQFGGASAAVDFTTAGIFFRQGQPRRALDLFQNAANIATTLTERRRALFNAGLAALQAGDFALYQALLGQLEIATSTASAHSKNHNDSAVALKLEKALFFASSRNPATEDSLRAFIRSHPDHPRAADAAIALAEWMLMAKPPRIDDARTVLGNIGAGTSVTPEQRQRIDYTRLWLDDAAGDLKTLIIDATTFLSDWPKSPLTCEVRLKIASAHYRQEDYASARTEFEIIARDYPDTPHAETALYFAAMSASSVMSPEGRKRALDIWEELAQKEGPLAVAARRQQALAERLQGNHAAALTALDQLLALKSLDQEQRRTTICEKAEVLLLLGKTEPVRLDEAATLLDAMLHDRALPFYWKARGGFSLAAAHHDAGHETEALEACYNVLRAADITPPASPADYVWFAKAGFFGVDLLEATQQWQAASRLAEQIAARPGDRAGEARARATKIRLEHFLWDGPAPKPPRVMTAQEDLYPRTAPEPVPAPKATRKSSR